MGQQPHFRGGGGSVGRVPPPFAAPPANASPRMCGRTFLDRALSRAAASPMHDGGRRTYAVGRGMRTTTSLVFQVRATGGV
ncbi:hypothetical protein EON67_05215 [archaeon]|nr:MAG: hypothetical protein EON67_05215 [archaeon]